MFCHLFKWLFPKQRHPSAKCCARVQQLCCHDATLQGLCGCGVSLTCSTLTERTRGTFFGAIMRNDRQLKPMDHSELAKSPNALSPTLTCITWHTFSHTCICSTHWHGHTHICMRTWMPTRRHTHPHPDWPFKREGQTCNKAIVWLVGHSLFYYSTEILHNNVAALITYSIHVACRGMPLDTGGREPWGTLGCDENRGYKTLNEMRSGYQFCLCLWLWQSDYYDYSFFSKSWPKITLKKLK